MSYYVERPKRIRAIQYQDTPERITEILEAWPEQTRYLRTAKSSRLYVTREAGTYDNASFVSAGDWIVQHGEGPLLVIPDDEFQTVYMPEEQS